MNDTGSTSCTERVFCESCKEGYDLMNTRCSGCPANCQGFSGLTTCQVCDLEYYLVSSTLCGNCPSHCEQCDDSVTCKVCNSGYFLYQDQCFNPCPYAMFGDSSDYTCKSKNFNDYNLFKFFKKRLPKILFFLYI